MKFLYLLLLCGSALAQQDTTNFGTTHWFMSGRARFNDPEARKRMFSQSKQDTTRWRRLEITASSIRSLPSGSMFHMYIKNDTLKFETDMEVDETARLVLTSMVGEYSRKIAQYDSLCQAYHQLRLYTAFFMWQVGRQDDNKITFDLAMKHLDYPACKLP